MWELRKEDQGLRKGMRRRNKSERRMAEWNGDTKTRHEDEVDEEKK